VTSPSVTLLYGTRPPISVAATPQGDALWMAAETLPSATGWTLKPEGLCQDDRCVPVPAGVALVRGSSREVDLTAMAGVLGQPVVRDSAHGVWCIGDAAPVRQAAMASLDAPDFTLPDLEGRPHSLSDYRGKKVFLVSWASW
jgi:hypothetical protein